MALNIDLKVLSANGFYDFVTPFYQTVLDLQQMPLIDKTVRRESDGELLSVGAHDLSRRRFAHAIEGGSREDVSGSDYRPRSHGPDSRIAATQDRSKVASNDLARV